jgi:murein DD-endopeptidase MepM/ murein hydrolase activator NlpD
MKMRQTLCALTVTALLALTFVGAAAASPESTAPWSAGPGGYRYYTVQPGDNLFRVSLRFGVSMYAVMQANGLVNPNYVYSGQVLRIPTGPQYPPVPQPQNHWVPAPPPCYSCTHPNPQPCGSCRCQTCDTMWTGTYFEDMFLQNPGFTRTDVTIDFNWGDKSPGSDVPKSFWSARWTKRASFEAGTYRFHAIVDDGVRLFVDGKIAIDEWEDNPGTEFIHDKYMTAGSHDLKVEYYQKAYDAKIKVWWEKL